MTKTKFCNPSLADGRDLLTHVLPPGQTEWRPSMNLYELIQQIPHFIQETLEADAAEDSGEVRKIGRFHLGLNYDMLTWLSNSDCRVFPCQQENEVNVKVKDKSGQVTK